MTSKKQIAFIFAILIVIGIIFTLTYLQIIIWNMTLILVLAVLCIITAVILIVWYWLSKRKKGVRLVGKDFNIDESKKLGQTFFAKGGLLFVFPSTHLCYGETAFGSKGMTRLHGFAGILFKRVKQIGTGKESTMQPINPDDLKEIGRGVVVVDATEKTIHSWYKRPYKEQYEDIWKRLGIASHTREPEIVTKVREVTPLGVEREEITAPITAEAVKPTEEKVV